MLERDFQAGVIRDLKKLFPGCVVIKNDPNYQQGFPDLLILHGKHWAALEVKVSINVIQPNQEYWINQLGKMSYAAFISPENREDVLDALQLAFRARR